MFALSEHEALGFALWEHDLVAVLELGSLLGDVDAVEHYRVGLAHVLQESLGC